MATWKAYRVYDVINDIDEERFVLPVIQRSLVWTENKMELLFDTLLKGDSFGGIMVIEEERDTKPLFNYRPFTKDGEFIPSKQVDELRQNQNFVIDGQQRLQSFYIGLKGTINGKNLFFDLFSDFNSEYEFKFEKDQNKLPKFSKENAERAIPEHLWYPVKDLLRRLKDVGDEDQVASEISQKLNLDDEKKQFAIGKNVKAFYRNVISNDTIGVSKVSINKSLPELDNRQKIVELFKRLNDGGTRLSSFDLVASILKGYSWEMEGFLKEVLSEYGDIGLDQDNLIKLIFLLQDNTNKEMAAIEAKDAEFAIQNQDRIKATIKATRDFLLHSKVFDYYKEGNQSFIPLFFIAYHLYHKDLTNEQIENYFTTFETKNSDFLNLQNWLYLSLLNGVFRSKGAGWIPYKTGIKRILGIVKNYKNKPFPTNEIFELYANQLHFFSLKPSVDNLGSFDKSFLYYLMYGRQRSIRINDEDHIMPKNILQKLGFDWESINSIKNYQLLDFGTNRGEKNGKAFIDWVNNANYVQDKDFYVETHLIPSSEEIWIEDKFLEFSKIRGELIVQKLNEYIKFTTDTSSAESQKLSI